MIGLSAIGFFHNETGLLASISKNRYENIFRMYPTEERSYSNKTYLFYNILNSVYIPTPLASGTFYTITLNRSTPWTVISYDEYQTTDLWWLIVLANNIYNPVVFPPAGTRLNIIKPRYISTVIDTINKQLIK